MSTASTATTKSKRKAAGRAKNAKPKKAKTTRGKKKQADPEPEDDETQEPQADEQPLTQESSLYPTVPELGSTDRFERFETPAEGIERVEVTQYSDETPRAEAEVEAYKEPTGPPETEAPAILPQTESPLRQQDKAPISVKSPQLPRARASSQRRSSTRAKPPQSPSHLSDVENAPPSSLPSSSRPPLSSPGAPQPQWTPVDVDLVFNATPVAELFKTDGTAASDAENLSETEKQMTVQEWIEYVAGQAEKDLRTEGERVVGVFEKEGQRALNVLEGIVCV